MSDNIQDDNYLYSSTRIRALENTIVSRDKCDRMIESRGIDEIYRILEENGLKLIVVEDEKPDFEDTLMNLLSETFGLIKSIAPDPKIFEILQYPYDCHNIKSAIKCKLRGVSCDKLIFSFGSISGEDIKNMAQEREFKLLPHNMAIAAAEAFDAYAKTSDPQIIDILIDNACYMDMLEKANSLGYPFFIDLVIKKIDITNILISIRLMRMKGSHINVEFLKRTLIPLGKLSESFFADAFDGGEPKLYETLRFTDYSSIGTTLEGATPLLTKVEKVCEDSYLEFIKKTKYKSSGPDVLAAYIIGREYEVKNIRIILAGKTAGLSSDVIRERLRISYV